MPKYPFKVTVCASGGRPTDEVVEVPYATTALLYSELQRSSADAVGIMRYKDGRTVLTTYPKLNMAKCTSATHGFVVTRDPKHLVAGLPMHGVKALNPDIAISDDLGLFDCASGVLPALVQPAIWTKDEVAAHAHSDSRFVEFPVCIITGARTGHTISLEVSPTSATPTIHIDGEKVAAAVAARQVGTADSRM